MEIKIYKYPKDTKDLLIRDFDPNLIGQLCGVKLADVVGRNFHRILQFLTDSGFRLLKLLRRHLQRLD